MPNPRRLSSIAVLAATLFALTSTSFVEAQTPVAVRLSAAREAALRARVLAWWTARVNRDFERMYLLYDPAYRAKTTRAQFFKEMTIRSRFDLSDPNVVSITPKTPTTVCVQVHIGADLGRLGDDVIERPNEPWVLKNGRWFKVYEPPPLPFPPSPGTPVPACP